MGQIMWCFQVGVFTSTWLDALLVFLSLSMNLKVVDSEWDNGDSAAGEFFHYDQKLGGHRLKGHILQNISVPSLLDCTLACMRSVCCSSVNYRETSIHEFPLANCELVHKSSVGNSPEDLIKDESYVHYAMVNSEGKGDNFCCSSPCRMDSSCDFVSETCLCAEGHRGRFCEIAIGSAQHYPGKSCLEIQRYLASAPSGNYWIQPVVNSTAKPFSVYCDMETEHGGWTLVYKYTFTNYHDYFDDSNAVTPRPSWPAEEGTVNVPVSTNPPSDQLLGAVDFALWKEIGDEFLITSNINDWITCIPSTGSIVEEKDGEIMCSNIKNVAKACSWVKPTVIQWRSCGPRIATQYSTFYRFDGSTEYCYPTHDPCDHDDTTYHKRNVNNPGGSILLRNLHG